MAAAIGVDQSKDMLGLAQHGHNVRTLDDHGRMGPGDHSCGTGRQALSVGILGMVDFFIPLGAMKCEDELLAGQEIPSNVIHSTAKPHYRHVRMKTWTL